MAAMAACLQMPASTNTAPGAMTIPEADDVSLCERMLRHHRCRPLGAAGAPPLGVGRKGAQLVDVLAGTPQAPVQAMMWMRGSTAVRPQKSSKKARKCFGT
ncbi:hypothetical protein B0H19DRAFT_1077694 [Mycena capillaripes]|nr:hypothetical protein B0H19DRAFT_1077694 [Mycena capillaripes]